MANENFDRAERAWLEPPSLHPAIEHLMDDGMDYEQAVDHLEGLREEAAERQAERRAEQWDDQWE